MNLINTINRLFFLFLFSLTLFGQAFASTPSKNKPVPITVQINWNHQFEFAGFYAAIKEGYYQDAGLDVTVKAWKPGIYGVDEVVDGRADFATGYTSIIADYAKGDPISLVMASFQFSPMILLSHEPILNLQQMSGKKVMHYGNMQIKALIAKANAVSETPVVEQLSSGDLNDFINKNTDFYAAYNTNEPNRLRRAGVNFYILDPKAYGIQSYGDLVFTSHKLVKAHPERVAAFREATIRGWKYAIEHQEETVDYILANYDVVKDRDALLQEAAATKVYVQSGNNEIGSVNKVKLMASAVDARETGLLTQEELDHLDVDNFLFKSSKRFLTEEEKAYLRENPIIKIGNDSNWEPFEFVDEKGVYKGIAADYFAIISNYLGVKFEHLDNMPWSEVVKYAENGDIPIYSCAVATPQRQKYMKFTNPYLSFPLVLVASESTNFIDDYSQLNGKVVAVPKGYWSQEWLQSNYPKINLLLVDSVREGLEAVLNGKAEAYSGNLASINFAIKRYGLNGLNIVGNSDARFELAIGVNKNDPVLFSIMQKALDNISSEQKDLIYNKWIQLQMIQTTDRSTLIAVIITALLVGLFLIFIIYLFYRQKQRQAFFINQVNELSMASYTNMDTHRIEWVSESFLKLVGCKKEDVIGQPHEIFKHPSVPEELYEEISKMIEKGEVWSGELRAQSCSGKDYWVYATITPEFKHGRVIGAWTTRSNITDKKRLEKMAVTDELTGVYNRNQFNDLFDKQIRKAARTQTSFCMAMFDVDDFKFVNDRYGHQRGDEVLQAVMKVTKKYFGRSNDLIFRVGGEEFVILSDFENVHGFEDYLNEFRNAVHKLEIPNPDASHKVVTVSIGALFCKRMNPFVEASQIYSKVDKVLYKAKNSGRNCVVMDSGKEMCE